jgi:hypothetical protein
MLFLKKCSFREEKISFINFNKLLFQASVPTPLLFSSIFHDQKTQKDTVPRSSMQGPPIEVKSIAFKVTFAKMFKLLLAALLASAAAFSPVGRVARSSALKMGFEKVEKTHCSWSLHCALLITSIVFQSTGGWRSGSSRLLGSSRCPQGR